MRTRPIIMRAESVRATLDKSKTQTRRIVKWPIMSKSDGGKRRLFHPEDAGVLNELLRERHRHPLRHPVCTYGRPGDRLWVREAFAIESNRNIDSAEAYPPPFGWSDPLHPVRQVEGDDYYSAHWEQCHYKATDPEPELDWEGDPRPGCRRCESGDPHAHWRSPIHMPRWASRLTLEVLAVRVERVQDISDEDALAEGSQWWPGGPRRLFSVAWNRLHGPGAWERNDWVWVVEYRDISNKTTTEE